METEISGFNHVMIIKGDVTGDDSQQQFLTQQSVATLLRHCFE